MKQEPGESPLQQKYPVGDDQYRELNQVWKDLQAHIGVLQSDCHYHFISEGKWNAVQLLRYLVDQCGVGAVRISTWSASENSVRELVELVHGGLITDLQCLFDHRVVQHTPGAYELARNNFPVKLKMTHAKITAVMGPKMSAVVIGSANYTDNRRIEAGIVTTCPAAVKHYFDFLTNKINEDE